MLKPKLKQLVLTFLLFELIYGQSTTCRTATGDAGSCSPLKTCAPLKTISDKRVKTPEDIQLLRVSHCGMTPLGSPKVCCPIDSDTWTTPRSQPATEPIIRPQTELTHTNPKPAQAKPQPIPTSIGSETSPGSDECKPTTGLPKEGCCGIDSSSALSNRITGGNDTTLEEYPWLALVEYHREIVYPGRVEKLVKTLCGGTLISSRYVLTAAHCITGTREAATNVRLSEYDTSTSRDCVDTEGYNNCITAYVVPIERSIPHSGYDSRSKNHDIGLFRLQHDAPYTKYIRPICMPSKDASQYIESITFTVAGWGWDGKENSKIKQHVRLPYVPLSRCNPTKPLALTEKQVCAGGEEGQDSCTGDSGGPLMYETRDLVYELVGVVSFGPKKCGTKGAPAVYTNVYKYIDWIKTHMVN